MEDKGGLEKKENKTQFMLSEIEVTQTITAGKVLIEWKVLETL